MTPINEEPHQAFVLSREKIFYKIGEVSKIVGLEAHIIRYWETIFPHLKPKKSKSGQRVYTKKEIDLLIYIKKLQKEEGYTMEGIRKKINAKIDNNTLINQQNECFELISNIKDRLNKILSEIK